MEAAVNLLRDTICILSEIDVQSIDWTHKPATDKWSKKEIIGHLIDSAQINLQRFVRCTYTQNFKLTYDQVEWVAANHYQEADIYNLLQLWKLLNLQIVHLITNYPSDRLLVKCDTGKTDVCLDTVEFLAGDYIDHLRHHLKDVIPSIK